MPDKDVIKGKAKNVEGHVQQAIGDLTDNPRDKSEGQAKKVQGKLHESVGHVKDAARAAADSMKH